jgi:hypothetical protein
MEETKSTGQRRRGRREIEKLLGEYRASGLGQAEFAAAHRISRATLIRWLRCEKERTAAVPDQEREAGVDLVEVTLAGNRSMGSAAASGRDEAGYDYALEWPVGADCWCAGSENSMPSKPRREPGNSTRRRGRKCAAAAVYPYWKNLKPPSSKREPAACRRAS